MEQQESKKNGITEGVIWKQILIFFFPILVGTFFQQLYDLQKTGLTFPLPDAVET